MNTSDVNFYTVKQIDDYLHTDEILAQSTSDYGKWFALQHTRNTLIDRLKTRLAIANGCDGAIVGSKRADVLLDNGFRNYEVICGHTGDSPVRPSQETEDSLRGFMAALLDGIAGISAAKFVFDDESAEIVIRTDVGLELSFELLYASFDLMFVHAVLPNGTTRDGHTKYDVLDIAVIPAFSEQKALELHRKASRENMTRTALSLIRGIN